MKKQLMLAIFASLIGSSFAQDKPVTRKEQQVKGKPSVSGTPTKQATKKRPVAKFSMGMIESGRIDPGYSGFPVSEAVDAVEKMTDVKKEEFESTADYNARKAAALTRKFLGDSSVEDVFAFVTPVGKVRLGGASFYRDGLNYEFDADSSEVRLYALPRSSSLNGIGAPDYQTNRRKSEGLDQFDLDFKIDSRSTYQASNAYGAKVTVEKTSSTRLGIAVSRIPFLSFKREIFYSKAIPAAQFNLENSKAAKELPAMKALVVMKMTDPYILYNFFHSEPTRDKPEEMSSSGKYLTGEVLGIVFYSGITGEIFARLPAAFGKTEVQSGRSVEERQQEQSAPVTIIKDCLDCPEMVVVGPGTFQMGTENAAPFETPAHTVRIDQAFALAKTEVTQGQWRAIMGNNSRYFSNCGDTCPVENVSWKDAQEFVKKLSQKTAKTYRLPSEAEWEYACRAGGRHEYCGSDNADSVAWYLANSGGRPRPVAGKQANAWGLYDMSGSSWEWVEDCFNAIRANEPTNGSARTDAGCSNRVQRGGSWKFPPQIVRATNRGTGIDHASGIDTGFRPVRMLP